MFEEFEQEERTLRRSLDAVRNVDEQIRGIKNELEMLRNRDLTPPTHTRRDWHVSTPSEHDKPVSTLNTIKHISGEVSRIRDNLESVLERTPRIEATHAFERFPELKKGDERGFRSPKTELIDLGDKFVLSFELPGVKKEDVDLRMDSDRIWLEAKCRDTRKKESGLYLMRENRSRDYRRVVSIPASIIPSKAAASFDKGILEIRLPKEKPEKGVQKVNIK